MKERRKMRRSEGARPTRGIESRGVVKWGDAGGAHDEKKSATDVPAIPETSEPRGGMMRWEEERTCRGGGGCGRGGGGGRVGGSGAGLAGRGGGGLGMGGGFSLFFGGADRTKNMSAVQLGNCRD